MGLSVIIPSKNASNLNPCMRRLEVYDPGQDVIVVDDGLDWDCVAGWESWPRQTRSVPGIKPFIFARNVNLGIIEAHPEDDVILLNDDAMLETRGGFSKMWLKSCSFPEYGIISATTNLAGNPNQQPQRGFDLRDERRTVAFVCVLITRRCIDAIGLLDERFDKYGWEDNDYCRRALNAGFKLGIYDGCYVDHGSLTSTFRGHPRAPGDIGPGAQIYADKWGDFK